MSCSTLYYVLFVETNPPEFIMVWNFSLFLKLISLLGVYSCEFKFSINGHLSVQVIKFSFFDTELFQAKGEFYQVV